MPKRWWPRQPLIDGYGNGHPVAQVGIVLQQQITFPVCTRHHLELSGKVSYGIHRSEDITKSKKGGQDHGNVLYAHPYELGQSTACLITKVAVFNESNGQVPRHGIERDTGPRCAAANDNHIELFTRVEMFQLFGVWWQMSGGKLGHQHVCHASYRKGRMHGGLLLVSTTFQEGSTQVIVVGGLIQLDQDKGSTCTKGNG